MICFYYNNTTEEFNVD